MERKRCFGGWNLCQGKKEFLSSSNHTLFWAGPASRYVCTQRLAQGGCELNWSLKACWNTQDKMGPNTTPVTQLQTHCLSRLFYDSLAACALPRRQGSDPSLDPGRCLPTWNDMLSLWWVRGCHMHILIYLPLSSHWLSWSQHRDTQRCWLLQDLQHLWFFLKPQRLESGY